MPFEYRTFVRMFRLAFRDAKTPRRRKVLWFLVFAIPVLAAFDALCLMLDHLLFPGFRDVAVRAPVFVIGHARSGTTLTHRLLTGDERFAWSMTYELFLPALTQRKLVRLITCIDRRHFDSALTRRIEAWEDRTFVKGRQMHPMSLTGPEEDEFILSKTGLSGTIALIFPYMADLAPLSRLDEQTDSQRRRVMDFYRRCIQRQLYLDGVHKTYLCKCPGYSQRVETLLEWFPDARFIVNMRHPYEPIPSLLKMMVRNWQASGVPKAELEESLEVMKQISLDHYRHPLEVLEKRPATPWTPLDYEQLVESPKRAILDVYERLGMQPTPRLVKSLDQEEQRSAEHRAEHVYSLDEFGLTRAEIRRELGPLFERFGWQA